MLFVRNVVIINGPEALTRKMRTEVGRVCGEGIAMWHRRFLPRHFRPGAAARYSYKLRSKDYLARKRRRYPGAPLLVLTGLTRRQALRAIFIRSRGTRAVGVMHVPSYIRIRPRHRNAPNMANEILATTPDEVRELGEYIKGRLINTLSGGMRDRKEVRLAG